MSASHTVSLCVCVRARTRSGLRTQTSVLPSLLPTLHAETAARERIGGRGVAAEAKPLSDVLAKIRMRKQAVVAKWVEANTDTHSFIHPVLRLWHVCACFGEGGGAAQVDCGDAVVTTCTPLIPSPVVVFF